MRISPADIMSAVWRLIPVAQRTVTVTTNNDKTSYVLATTSPGVLRLVADVTVTYSDISGPGNGSPVTVSATPGITVKARCQIRPRGSYSSDTNAVDDNTVGIETVTNGGWEWTGNDVRVRHSSAVSRAPTVGSSNGVLKTWVADVVEEY